jgi:hypothetical protein
MVNTSQQVGGSVGTALLSTIFASAAAGYATSHIGAPGLADAAAIHGYTVAFAWATGIFALGLIVALLVLPSKARSGAPAPSITVDDGTLAVHDGTLAVHDGTPATARAAAHVTAILVTGPCCHFAVLARIEHIRDRAHHTSPS